MSPWHFVISSLNNNILWHIPKYALKETVQTIWENLIRWSTKPINVICSMCIHACCMHVYYICKKIYVQICMVLRFQTRDFNTNIELNNLKIVMEKRTGYLFSLGKGQCIYSWGPEFFYQYNWREGLNNVNII